MNPVQKVLWAAFLIFLPVTSFPYFPPAIGGEALVRPLSLYPLLILLPFAVLPRLIKKTTSSAILSLLTFALVATASSLLSLLRGIEPTLGVSAAARFLRGLFTLGIGCSIYLATALLPDSPEDLRFTLRWIYAGFAVALLWGTLQTSYIIRPNPQWFATLDRLQEFISIRRLLPERISGMTYEPHWFAEQIILLLTPWSLAAILSGRSVFRWRWRWLTVEWLLFLWGILLLPFTYSRAGVLNLLILVFFSILFLGPNLVWKKIGSVHALHPEQTGKPSREISRYLVLALLAAVFVALPVYTIGARNAFFSRLWAYWEREDTSLNGYLSYLGFDARLAFNQAALNTYNAYPLLGVGLGNYAFYFEEMLPYRPLAFIPEVMRQITPEPGRDRLITAKNLYLRLLAETGIVGAVTFLAFVIANLGGGIYLWLSPDAETKYWGTASLCGLMGFLLAAFSFDSFVIPNMWVVFGLVTAAARIYRRTFNSTESNPTS
jgi:hypothetical protein